MTLTKENKKICILRLSAIGDVTHVIPVIREIQKQLPGAEITWICGKFEYKLLHIIKGIRFIVFDKKNGFKEYRKLWKTLKGERFNVLLQMQVAARANIASLGIKADIKLGWDKARSRDFHQFFVNKSIAEEKQQHQVQAYLSFARALGLQADEPVWDMPVTEKAKVFSDKYLGNDKPILIISACSSHELRNWLADRYAALADYAISKYDMQVVLSGGPAEIEINMAQEIISNMKGQPLNLVGKDTLEQLLGLLSKASVVVSPDSGPAHIANAIGVPVIGLYACTWSKRSGPYDSLDFCVDKFELAAEFFLNKSADELYWPTKIEMPGVMELIEVSDVCEQLDKIMKNIN
ncbi:ADP-heptose--lipooligosaccharide heptosyltransferase II [hydrothermal vent metagenome]|uniref:ADP-heptose--lipooligosaccharide heptosyltransferase II n=1 Tax=hydrothermal vent metagenome TaxID=652676 RepID=A0A3B0XBJ9_9ZZZZ